jgi:hypothetical protein
MSLIVTVCGRKFRCAPRSAVLQEISEEVRQHLHPRSSRVWKKPGGELWKRAGREWRHAVEHVGNAYGQGKLAVVRATMAARPIVLVALGL